MIKRLILGMVILVGYLAGAVYASTITVHVTDLTGSPMQAAKVIIAGISPTSVTGDPDPSTMDIKFTDINGNAVFTGDKLKLNYNYSILVGRQGYDPTVREQMNNSAASPVKIIRDSDNITINRRLYRHVITPGYGSLQFIASNISDSIVAEGTPIVADVRINGADTAIGFGFSTVTQGYAVIDVENIPESEAINTYKAYLNIMQGTNNLGIGVIVSTDVAAGEQRIISVDFTDASNVSNVDNGNNTPSTDASFMGVVLSTDSQPLSGALIMLMRHNPNRNEGDFADSEQAYQTFSDRGGNFSFYNVSIDTYAISINKKGYLGVWDQNWGYMDFYNISRGYYYGGEPIYISQPYKLERGLGRIKGRVLARDMNSNTLVGVANANIHTNGLWDTWQTIPDDPYDNSYTTGTLKGGCGWGNTTSDTQGYFEIDGLGSGNFDLNIWSNMSQSQYNFSNGYDQYRNNNFPRGGDDLRIQITADTHITTVYSSWTVINSDVSNQPIEIIISTLAARGGIIKGHITFKDFERYPDRSNGYYVVVSSKEPISIIASEATNSWPKNVYSWDYGNGSLINGPLDYEIMVSTNTYGGHGAASYWLEVKSTKWAVLNQMDTRCDFSNTLEITDKNFTLVPSGSMKVVIKDQFGNIIKKTNQKIGENSYMYISGRINLSGPINWSSDLQEQEETIIYGLVPGVYKVGIELYRYINTYDSNSQTNTYTSLPSDYPKTVINDVNVAVDNTAYVEVNLKPATLVIPSGSALAMPPLAESALGFYSIGGWKAGETITAETLSKTLFSSTNNEGEMPDDLSIGFMYSNDQWESKRVPDNKYDFYLGYTNLFNPQPSDDSPMKQNFRQSFTVITALPGIDIKYDELNPYATTYLNFGSGTLGNCTIRGEVKASKFFTHKDVEKIASAGTDEFFKYIPTIMIYDQQGSMKGFSNAMPTVERMQYWDAVMSDKSNLQNIDFMYDFFTTELSQYPLEYWCEKLPAGKYTLVIGQPNYPPAMRLVTLQSGENTLNVNLDESKVSGSTITGIVKSTEGVLIMGANITIRNKNANIEKQTTSNELGEFSFPGISPGVYRMDVSKGDYAIGGEKVMVRGNPVSVTILLKKSDASIKGTVFSQRMPAKVLPEAKIIAYDDTENGESSSRYLPVSKSISDNNGEYFIPGLISGHTYKIYCIAESKILEWRNETLDTGENSGIDFTLKPASPHLKVNTKKILENNGIAYNFVIEVPNKLVNPRNPNGAAAPYCRYSPISSPTDPFDESKATELLVEPGSNNTYSVTFKTPDESEYFKMRILAYDGMNSYYEDIIFGPKIEAKVKKDIIGELAEGGQVDIDSTGGDTTKIGLDAGAITPASTTDTTMNSGGEDVPIGGFLSSLPNFQLSRTQSSRSIAMQKLVDSIVASDVYDINLDSAQINKAITVTLNYDRSKVGENEINQLIIGRYNSLTEKWEPVNGIVTADPLTGSVSVDVDSIGGSNNNPAPKAKFNGKRFVLNSAAPSSQSGIYAVFTQDPNSVKLYSGSQFTIFNFPNPFNLKDKTVTVTDVTSNPSQSVKGTMIKYTLPSTSSGKIKFYIYNIAGELVKDMDLGVKDGGYYYYTEWDGKNDNGEDCASGVYFLIAKCDGKKLNSNPFKMAILK